MDPPPVVSTCVGMISVAADDSDRDFVILACVVAFDAVEIVVIIILDRSVLAEVEVYVVDVAEMGVVLHRHVVAVVHIVDIDLRICTCVVVKPGLPVSLIGIFVAEGVVGSDVSLSVGVVIGVIGAGILVCTDNDVIVVSVVCSGKVISR